MQMDLAIQERALCWATASVCRSYMLRSPNKVNKWNKGKDELRETIIHSDSNAGKGGEGRMEPREREKCHKRESERQISASAQSRVHTDM
eukprot:1966229-Rhodomonas_salina.3